MRKFFLLVMVLTTTIDSLSQCYGTIEEVRKYYEERLNNLASIEGIWSSNSTSRFYDQFNRLVNTQHVPQTAEFAIYKDGEEFKACILKNSNPNDKSSISFNKTSAPNIYLYKKVFPASNSSAKANAVVTDNTLLEYSYEVPIEEMKFNLKKQYVPGMSVVIEIKMIKLFPNQDSRQTFNPSSGTGFAISPEGYIVTNHHVIAGASYLKVRGINGDYSNTFDAKVIIEDKANDLAIIKTEVPSNILLQIPFNITSESIDVGKEVFALGYPLRATMGDEIKLTNGIISSKSGFQGNVTTYQITVPVQPGNSGGPLFDENGNIVGVISAKHLRAENASYAIKSTYLMSLIDLLSIKPNFKNIMTDKSLTDKVKLLSNVTFIIEAY